MKTSASKRLRQVDRAAMSLAGLFTDATAAFTRNTLKAIGSMIIIASISWQIALGILLTVVIYSIIHVFRFRRDRVYSRLKNDLVDKEMPRYWELLPQAKLTKIFSKEAYEIERLDRLTLFREDILKKRERLWAIADMLDAFLVKGGTLLVKFYAAYLALTGTFGLATFVLIYALIDRAQSPFWVINWFIWEAQDTYIRAERFVEIMSSETTITSSNAQATTSLNGDIKLENVTFQYQDGHEAVIEDMDMTFEEHKFTALVGRSGSGKSTIVNLVCRFFDPTSGKITIGGQDISEVRLEDLRSKIGFIFQESYVFSGTIAENLRYGNLKATDDQIVTALKKANAWEFISRHEQGIETVIGERGIKLSGGQRQRLAIARALLKDPEILILDEATNALDSEGELLVQSALEEFMKGRTVIAIAHRLSTIQNADQIYVIGDKAIEEQGTHQNLINQDGIYKQLFDIQSGKFEEQMKLLREYEMA